MKKLLLVLPIVVLLAAGCNPSQQAFNQTPVTKNTNPATTTPAVTPTSTSITNRSKFDCKNYQDLGIIFSCPKDYYIIQYEDNTAVFKNYVGLEIYDKNNPINIEDSLTPNLNISVFEDTFNGSLDSYLKVSPQCPAKLTGKTTIGGKVAYILVNKSMYECGSEELVFSNGKVYTFYNSASPTKLPLNNSLISSIQFYNPTK